MKARLSSGRLAGALTLWACAQASAQTAPAADPALEVHGRWRIEQARTEPIYDRALARLEFGANGRLSGHTSCNTLSAAYVLEGERLRVDTISTSRQRCGRLQLEQEDRILSALELAATARVRPDGLLELREAEGRGVLRATRLPAGE